MSTSLNLDGRYGAEAMLSVLTAAGIRRVFASPGSEWAPFWEALSKTRHSDDQEPVYTSVGHEELAVAMASGYAKSTGELPAVMIHTTVGALHASMAMRAANHEQTPMVVIAGESIAFGEDSGPDPGGQWLAHLTDLGGPAALVERCVKWSARVPDPSLLPSMIARACHIAETSPPGPVFVSVPMEYLFATMNGALTVPPPPTRPVGDEVALHECARRLLAAKRPLFVTEEAGRNREGVTNLQRLAELLAARVVETRGSRFMNFPRRHPLHSGFDPSAVMAGSDEIVMVGVLAPWHPSSRSPSPGASLTAIRENPLRHEVPYWGYPVDHVIHGAVDRCLARLVALVEDGLVADEHRDRRLEEIASANTARRAGIVAKAGVVPTEDQIGPGLAATALGRALPDDSIVVDETLTARRPLLEMIDRIGPGGYFSGAIGGLGTGLGTALGVKAANPDRLVVCTIGDGSLGYEPAYTALLASRDLNLPLLIVILNNSGYLSQKATIPKFFPGGSSVEHDDYPGLHIGDHVDFVKLAEAFGAYGGSVSDPGRLDESIEAAVKAATGQRLALLDIRLEPTSQLTNRGD